MHSNNHRVEWVLLAGILAIALLVLFFFEPAYEGPIDPTGVKIISHRGFGTHAPDNSLAAATLAMEYGLDGIDVDGQLTSDGELIIFHDLSVDRLTTSTGRVSSKPLAELLALDLGEKYGNGFEGSYVHTFEDFLEEVDGKGIYMVELKVTSAGRTGIEERAVEIIREHDAYEWVYLSSFNPITLYRLKKLDPRVHTVMIMMDTNWNDELRKEITVPGDLVDLPWFLRQEPIRRVIRKIVKPDLLSVNHEVDEKTIDRLLDAGYPIFLWTPNNASVIVRALDKHPYGVITDEPLLGKQLRDGTS